MIKKKGLISLKRLKRLSAILLAALLFACALFVPASASEFVLSSNELHLRYRPSTYSTYRLHEANVGMHDLIVVNTYPRIRWEGPEVVSTERPGKVATLHIYAPDDTLIGTIDIIVDQTPFQSFLYHWLLGKYWMTPLADGLHDATAAVLEFLFGWIDIPERSA